LVVGKTNDERPTTDFLVHISSQISLSRRLT
jgi:hypothetical protein